jgi:hypothetical protein
MILADLLDFIDDSKAFTLEYDGHTVEFQDEYGLSCGSNGEWFVAGHEFGACVLIHARGFESAWEAWIDESPTIPESELPEAYGIDETAEMLAWKDVNPSPRHCGAGPEFQAWADRKNAEAIRILQAWDEAARAGERDDYPELIEGYEYQSNASGTGIVDVGHYAWMNEADLTKVEVIRKAVEAENANGFAGDCIVIPYGPAKDYKSHVRYRTREHDGSLPAMGGVVSRASKFSLEIELGNEAMMTTSHVRAALRELAEHMVKNAVVTCANGTIRDINGNTVGKWEFR